MTTLTWQLPAVPAASQGISSQELASQYAKLFGADIWFDVSDETGGDTKVTAAGDWVKVEGKEALRQAITRRIITNPGEWRTLPNYGVGARQFVKERNTPANRDNLEQRIKSQLLQDARIASVDSVSFETIQDGLKIGVVVTPIGQTQQNGTQLKTIIEVT